MKKIAINADNEYVIGNLRYGHSEGVIELTDEEYELFKKDPENFIYEYIDENDVDLELIIDDYEVDDVGPIYEINYKEI